MTTTDQASQDGQSYILDQESATEMARLLLQDRLINHAMGGPLPEQKPKDLKKIHTVLDIGCGPAGWVLDVATNYPHMHVVGIDNSETMLNYAHEQVKLHSLKNIEIKRMDALQKLKFSDQQFDLVNIRNAAGYVRRDDWQKLLEECYRITRQGGILRLAEGDSMGLTNSLAYEQHHRLGTRAMQMLGYGFSPDGYTLGMTPVLGKLLKQAGYTQIQMQPYFFNFSYGTSLHSSHIQNIAIVFKASQALLTKANMISQEELDALYLKVLEQISSENFRGMGSILVAWGKK